jgi:transcriptional/translational regulatory protein YebC/TACO1
VSQNTARSGSVAWRFDRRGLVTVRASDEDEVLLAAAEAGAEDVRPSDDLWEVVCDAKDFSKVREAVAAAGLEIDNAELTMLPQTTVPVTSDDARAALRLMDALDDLDDTQNVYTNFDIPDEVLAEVS